MRQHWLSSELWYVFQYLDSKLIYDFWITNFSFLWQGSWKVELWRGHRSLFVFEAVGKSSNMDNYVDCSQCPGIYGRTPAIYDRWRHQWELVNDMKQGRLAAIKCQFLTLFNFRSWQKVFFFWSESEMGKECSARCFLQAWNICNSSKNFSRYFSNFSQKMMFISLAVFRVLLLQTLKKSGYHEIFEDEKE